MKGKHGYRMTSIKKVMLYLGIIGLSLLSLSSDTLAQAPGDANGDGQINILDVTVILNDILEIAPAPGNGDCNNDGQVNILDVTCVLNIILGIPAIELEEIVTDLDAIVAITHAGDGSGRLFITLQEGKIMIFDGTNVLSTPFLDISPLVSCCGERGLLSVAFHPNYENNGFFYVNYTNNNGDTRVVRYSVSANSNIADSSSAHTMLEVNQPESNHNGGQLQFGPDGLLYIGMGDGGGGGDPQDNAQNMQTLLGKMLRIDVDGDDFSTDNTRNYSIPPSNPFVGDPNVLDEIWSSGLRNPWRFSFDCVSGDLFIGDVGQSSFEEIDFQPAASTGGENYGWRCYEGNADFNLMGCGPVGNCIFPIYDYSHSLGCSVTGGYVYRGNQVIDLIGHYLFGDFCSGRIWGSIRDQNSNWVTDLLLDSAFLISTFGEDEDGELYVAHYSSSGSGSIYQIVSIDGGS